MQYHFQIHANIRSVFGLYYYFYSIEGLLK